MHTIKYCLFGIIILFSIYSCETDFDTTADWEDITVVYGIIDQNDSMQYIKINKAFLGEGDVLQFAQEYDSTHYSFPLRVWIDAYNNSDQLVQTIEFDTATSYKPDDPDAVFPTGAQTIYKGGPETFYEIKYIIDPPFDTVGYRKLWLDDRNTYTLNILFPDSSKFVSAETELIMDFEITRPLPQQKFIKFVPNSAVPTLFEWEKPDNDQGKFKYELHVVFNYQELTQNNSLQDKSIDLISNVTVYPPLGGDKMVYYYWDNSFFVSCVNNIPYDDPDEEANIKERYTVDVEIIISVAGEAFNLFMQVYEPSNSIIQEKPPYTNVENGIGVYSARFRITDDKFLHQETVQDLRSIDDNFMKFVY